MGEFQFSMTRTPGLTEAEIDLRLWQAYTIILNLRNREQYPNLVELFAAHRDDLLVYFTTNTSSQKLGQIRADPRVSVYYCNPEQFHGLMLSGDVEVIDDSALRHALWSEGWERYYPGGPDDPDHTVLLLRPRSVRGWYKARRFEFETL